MPVRKARKFLDIQNYQRRIGDGLRKHALRIRPEGLRYLFLRSIRIHHGTFDPHLFHGTGEQIKSTTVYGRRKHHMISRFADIEHRIVTCRLAGRSEHRRHAALQLTDLGRNTVVGGVLQPAVEITVLLQIKKTPHLLRRLIFESRTLTNRQHPRLPVLRLPSRLDAYRFLLILSAHLCSPAFLHSRPRLSVTIYSSFSSAIMERYSRPHRSFSSLEIRSTHFLI